MFVKDTASSLSSGAVLFVFCLILYSTGFVRIELKFDDHDRRLDIVEEVVALMKHKIARENLNSNEGKRRLSCVSR